MSLDRTFQINATAPKHSVTCSQHDETHPAVQLRQLQDFVYFASEWDNIQKCGVIRYYVSSTD